MRTALSRLCNLIDAIFMTSAKIFLMIVLIASSTQVFTRYLLNASLTGTEELARYAFLWLSMLGCAICVAKWAHPSVTILIDVLSKKWQKVAFMILNLLIGCFSLIFIIEGSKLVSVTMDQQSPTLMIPMFLIYLCIPVGGFGILVNALRNIASAISELKALGKEEEVNP